MKNQKKINTKDTNWDVDIVFTLTALALGSKNLTLVLYAEDQLDRNNKYE